MLQESPAIADKPARRETLPKLLQFDVPTTLSLTILAYYLHSSECSDVKNCKWLLNPVLHRMLYSFTNIATVGVKGLNE